MTLSQLQAALAAGKGTPTFKVFFQDVVMPGSGTNSGLLKNQRIVIDSAQGWFVMQRLMTDQAAGSFRFQIYPDGGNAGYISTGQGGASNNLARNELLFGNGSLPFVLGIPMIFPPNGNIVFDVQNIGSASPVTAEILFAGFLFFPD